MDVLGSLSKGVLETVIEQKLPLELLNSAAEHFVGATAPIRRLAQIDEREGIPGALRFEESGRLIGRRSGQLGGPFAQRLEDRVLADTSKPILRVTIIRLAAMHDPVPRAALHRVDILSDRVRLIDEVV